MKRRRKERKIRRRRRPPWFWALLGALGSMASAAGGAVGSAAGAVGGALGSAGSAIGGAASSLGGALGGAAQGAGGAVGNLAGAVAPAVQAAGQGVGQAAQAVGQGIGQGAQAVGQAAGNAGQGLINAAQGAGNALWGGAKGVGSSVKGLAKPMMSQMMGGGGGGGGESRTGFPKIPEQMIFGSKTGGMEFGASMNNRVGFPTRGGRWAPPQDALSGASPVTRAAFGEGSSAAGGPASQMPENKGKQGLGQIQKMMSSMKGGGGMKQRPYEAPPLAPFQQVPGVPQFAGGKPWTPPGRGAAEKRPWWWYQLNRGGMV